jgi:hypothetical protein
MLKDIKKGMVETQNFRANVLAENGEVQIFSISAKKGKATLEHLKLLVSELEQIASTTK